MLLFNKICPFYAAGFSNLNTSHVIVQPFASLTNSSFFQFKYISCYCSTRGRPGGISMACDLNTSHVIVQQFTTVFVARQNFNLNTSHVIVQRRKQLYDYVKYLNLNTSHVIVQPLNAIIIT